MFPSPIDSTDHSSERNKDGKSFRNIQHGIKSKSYDQFTDGITNGERGGFDVHIYYYQVSCPWWSRIVLILAPEERRSDCICKGIVGTDTA